MLGGARKAAGPGYGTKITELMNLHLGLGFSRIANVVSDRCWKILSGHILPASTHRKSIPGFWHSKFFRSEAVSVPSLLPAANSARSLLKENTMLRIET